MKPSVLTFLAAAAAVSDALVARVSSPLVVDLGYAQYQGVNNATSRINSWYGIRYAAPPTGNLRWQHPIDIERSNNYSTTVPINATVEGPACVQGYPGWMAEGSESGQSEDCLLLDIKVPANPVSSSLPVVIQIHGGGYTIGDAESVSPGDALVYQSAGNIIYVSIQYRLGAYGFLGGADVTEHGTLNAGLLDQRAAIEWVTRHIHAFGGDASRVTITGASAGGGSVMNQMIMYGGEANPPFQAVLAEYPWWQPFHDSYVQERQYSVLLGLTDCADIACLRALSYDALANATQQSYVAAYTAKLYGYGDFFYGPVVDGHIIQNLPNLEFLQGHFTKVPLLVDHEGYEGVIFTNASLTTFSEETVDLSTLWPNAGSTFFDRLYQLYPASVYNSTFFQTQQIFGDAFVACPTYYMATAASNYDLPVWKLVFDAGSEVHGSTIPFLYSTSIDPTGNNATIATVMRDYFVSFFVSQDPNVGSYSKVTKPYWGAYVENGTFNVLDVNYTMIGMNADQDAKAGCDFFQANGYAIRN